MPCSRWLACGICGSDLSYISMGGVAGPARTPMCLGHEISGDGRVDRKRRPLASASETGWWSSPGDDELGRIGNGAARGRSHPAVCW